MKKYLVALHGFLGSGRDWDFLKPEFSEKMPELMLIAPDFFAENAEWPGPSLNLKDWAEAFNDLLRVQIAEHEAEVHLLGYSMGGRLALELLQDSPDLWASVTLLSTHPGLSGIKEKHDRLKTDSVWACRFEAENRDSVLADWYKQPVFESTTQAMHDLNCLDAEKLALALRNWSLAMQDFNAVLRMKFPENSRWIMGERDSKFCRLQDPLEAAGFAGRFEIWAEAGHRIHLDQPQRLIQALKEII